MQIISWPSSTLLSLGCLFFFSKSVLNPIATFSQLTRKSSQSGVLGNVEGMRFCRHLNNSSCGKPHFSFLIKARLHLGKTLSNPFEYKIEVQYHDAWSNFVSCNVFNYLRLLDVKILPFRGKPITKFHYLENRIFGYQFWQQFIYLRLFKSESEWCHRKSKIELLITADAVHELLSKYTKVTIRRPINAAFISPDESGLQMLIANENFRAALDLTEKLLNSVSQGRGTAGHISKNSVRSLRIWHARFTLFAKVSCLSFIGFGFFHMAPSPKSSRKILSILEG